MEVRQHGSIEKVLEALDPAKYPVPDPFPYQEARRLFKGAGEIHAIKIPSVFRIPCGRPTLNSCITIHDSSRVAALRCHTGQHFTTICRLRSADLQRCTTWYSARRQMGCARKANDSVQMAHTEPKVAVTEELPAMKWNAPDVEGLVKFLVEEKSFSEERIRKTAEKIDKSRGKASQGVRSSAV